MKDTNYRDAAMKFVLAYMNAKKSEFPYPDDLEFEEEKEFVKDELIDILDVAADNVIDNLADYGWR